MNRLTAIRDWRRLLVVFIAGMLVGLFVLGWWLFPVNWTNANLRDLREGAQNNYLTAVADSYAATGDLALAQERLREWTPAEMRILLNKLNARYNSDGHIQQAQNVQMLIGALDTSSAAPVAPAVTPTAAVASQSTQSLLAILALIAGIIIIGAGLAILLWLILGRRPAESTPATITTMETLPPAAPFARQQPGIRPAPPPPSISFEDQLPSALDEGPDADFDADDLEVLGSYEEEPPAQAFDYRPAPPAPDAEPPTPRLAAASAPASQVATTGRQLAAFDAVYRQGDTDYDEAFVVEGETGAGYRGECGMGVALARDPNSMQATALEIWLFDKSDIRTVTAVLASDFAFDNAEMMGRLEEKGDVVLARPGAGFQIQAKTLALVGRIGEMGYVGNAQEARSVFEHLSVHLEIYLVEAP